VSVSGYQPDMQVAESNITMGYHLLLHVTFVTLQTRIESWPIVGKVYWRGNYWSANFIQTEITRKNHKAYILIQKNFVRTNLELLVLYLWSDVCSLPAKYGLHHRLLRYNSYGSHLVVFVAISTTLIQSNTTHVYFNSNCYLYTCGACFGLHLSHPQACQYKSKLYKRIRYVSPCCTN